MDAQRFAKGDFTQQEVDAWRGTAKQTLERIRQKFNLGEDVFSDLDIFILASQHFYSHTEPDAKRNAEEQYAQYLASNQTTLPYFVLRAGDPDVDYPHMHAF